MLCIRQKIELAVAMKFLLVFISAIVLCSGHAVPLLPGDNSHYVEGISRYIWMSDDENIPLLVDLFEPPDEDFLKTRNGANNQYWLYTRSNPDTPQSIFYGNADSISNSSYDGNKPLKVIVHGWNNNGNSMINTLIKNAFLKIFDVNVIVIDWRDLSNSNYISASRGVPSVGEYLGNFLVWLIDTAGGDWNNVHLIGFSLGAHVVGNAGRVAGGQIARVTGLDAAGPLWGNNPQALNISSGRYVENIHTDGGLLGMSEPIAHVDFFPNGGKNPQPGCWFSICSHSRAYELYASSVENDHFIGRKCTDVDEAHQNQCEGSEYNMGNGIITKQGSGLYGLSTKSQYPY